MIDLEILHHELFGAQDIRYNSDGVPTSWVTVSRGSDKYYQAMQTYVLASLSNAIEMLANKEEK